MERERFPEKVAFEKRYKPYEDVREYVFSQRRSRSAISEQEKSM